MCGEDVKWPGSFQFLCRHRSKSLRVAVHVYPLLVRGCLCDGLCPVVSCGCTARLQVRNALMARRSWALQWNAFVDSTVGSRSSSSSSSSSLGGGSSSIRRRIRSSRSSSN